MGYFANGTEGLQYQEEHCSRCVHSQQSAEYPSCPVWDAHVLFAYEECDSKSNAEQILELLIPNAGTGNAQCALYHERPGAVDKRQLPLFQEPKS